MMNGQEQLCGCEVGMQCTKTTVCALQSAVEDALSNAKDPLQEFKDEVLQYAIDFNEAIHHGTMRHAVARANLLESVDLYLNELGDG